MSRDQCDHGGASPSNSAGHVFLKNEDSTVVMDNTQKANTDVGIVLEEVLEAAPKYRVLWVSDSVFVSFSSLSGPAVFNINYLLYALYERTVCSNLFGNGHCKFG